MNRAALVTELTQIRAFVFDGKYTPAEIAVDLFRLARRVEHEGLAQLRATP